MRTAAGVLAAMLAGCSIHSFHERTLTPTGDGRLDVVELDVAEAQRRMTAGTLTSRALTRAYLGRIAAIDDAGPQLAAVLELNPEAEAEAKALDRERAAGHVRGPLHGIPVLIKDNIDVAGMVTSAGSLALVDHRPREDAEIVKNLRAAGVVIVGKTNLCEWANFRGDRSTGGWSSRGGQTRNPYVLDRSPCGSSGGTGSAIAASLATVGVGTETDGSIMCPSAMNGLVGLKPTVGLMKQGGIVPISTTQDTAGPMARTVMDAALLLAGMTGGGEDYVGGMRRDALQGKRIGVLRQAMGHDAGVDEAMLRAIAALRAAGAEIVDPVEIATWEQWGEAEVLVLMYEFKAGIEVYLNNVGGEVGTLAGLIAWNKAHASAVMPWFGQEVFERVQALGGLDSVAYGKAKATARRLAWDEGLGATLLKHRLDAVVAPTMGGPAWPIDPVLGDRFNGAGYTVAAVAGTPSLTVPMGEVHGLPIGLVFMAEANAEARLLAMGYRFEQATQARRQPQFVPTLAGADQRSIAARPAAR